MRKILGDLGTMCLGIAAILIASVIISLGTAEGPQAAPAIGFAVLIVAGVVLRVIGDDASTSVEGR